MDSRENMEKLARVARQEEDKQLFLRSFQEIMIFPSPFKLAIAWYTKTDTLLIRK